MIAQAYRHRQQARQQPAAHAVAPFPGEDAFVAEHSPGRFEILEDLVGMNDVGPERERKTDRCRHQQQRSQRVKPHDRYC
jgi:hypothetical protein